MSAMSHLGQLHLGTIALTGCIVALSDVNYVLWSAVTEVERLIFGFGTPGTNDVRFVFLAVVAVWFRWNGLLGGWIGAMLGDAINGNVSMVTPAFAFIAVLSAMLPMFVDRWIRPWCRVDDAPGLIAFLMATTSGQAAARVVLDYINHEIYGPFESDTTLMRQIVASLLTCALLGFPLLRLFTNPIRRWTISTRLNTAQNYESIDK